MAMPEVREFYDPVFDVIAESGEALKSPKIRVEVAKRLQLTAEDLPL